MTFSRFLFWYSLRKIPLSGRKWNLSNNTVDTKMLATLDTSTFGLSWAKLSKTAILFFFFSLGRVFGSGMAAIATMASYLNQGDHIICSDDVYGGWKFFFWNRKLIVSNTKKNFGISDYFFLDLIKTLFVSL